MKKVTGIEIEIGGKKVVLGEDEARQLHSDLDRLFGRPAPGMIPYPQVHGPIPQPIRYPEIIWGDHTNADTLPPFPITTC
jgi:hypothetical protein